MVFQANTLATRLNQYGGSTRSKIEHAYQLLFSRNADEIEVSLAEQFLGQEKTNKETQEDPDAWAQYAQALLISNEMFMVD